MAAKRASKSTMTTAHKNALARGRTESAAVRSYLEALRSSKPTRGRKRTADTVRRRLAAIDAEFADANALDEVKLIQERMDLEAELAVMNSVTDLSALEQSFIAVAKSYSERQGITYAAWRQVGVQPAVLKAAGVTRGS